MYVNGEVCMDREQHKRGRPARVAGAVSDRKVSVRVSRDEHDALLSMAHQRGRAISDLVRVRLADLLAS